MPKRLNQELPGHVVKTVQDMGWAGIKNGALLRLANGQFDALLTADSNLEYQQNLKTLPVSVVVLVAVTNKLEDLKPLVPQLLARLASPADNAFARVGG